MASSTKTERVGKRGRHTQDRKAWFAERWRTGAEAVGRARARGRRAGGRRRTIAARRRRGVVLVARGKGPFAPLARTPSPAARRKRRPPSSSAPLGFVCFPRVPPALVARPGCKQQRCGFVVENLAASRPPPHQRTGRVKEKGAGLVCLLFLVRAARERAKLPGYRASGARAAAARKSGACVPEHRAPPSELLRARSRAVRGRRHHRHRRVVVCCWVVVCVRRLFCARALCGFFLFCSPEQGCEGGSSLSLSSPRVHALSLSLSSDSGGSIDRWG